MEKSSSNQNKKTVYFYYFGLENFFPYKKKKTVYGGLATLLEGVGLAFDIG